MFSVDRYAPTQNIVDETHLNMLSIVMEDKEQEDISVDHFMEDHGNLNIGNS